MDFYFLLFFITVFCFFSWVIKAARRLHKEKQEELATLTPQERAIVKCQEQNQLIIGLLIFLIVALVK